jgi:hypothetical protein
MSNPDGFIKLPYAVYDSPAFQQLKPIDVAVLLLLIRKHNGHNNGAISLGLREVVTRCHCSQMTAWRALESLQRASLISRAFKGHLVPEIGRPDVASRWKLNFIKETAPHLNGITNPNEPKKRDYPEDNRATAVPK